MVEVYINTDEKTPGLQRIKAEFGQMLEAGRHIFSTAANALLGGTDIAVVRKDLFDTERLIDEAERKIRRQLVVHAVVHGTQSFPSCLVLMSVVKDAERIGDYASNIYDLAVVGPPLHAAAVRDDDVAQRWRDELIRLKDEICDLIGKCHESFAAEDENAARQLIDVAERLEDQCDNQIADILQIVSDTDRGATFALAFRYFKRTASHLLNVLTSIVQPIDRIDYSEAKVGEQ